MMNFVAGVDSRGFFGNVIQLFKKFLNLLEINFALYIGPA
jgi:hypothetical protein